MTIKLYDNQTEKQLGELTESQLQFLIDQLEEETTDDQDYYLNPTTLEMLQNAGADADLIKLLRQSLGDEKGVEIRWSRT
jgi:processive 1,2-diacylglycerol beta-glucosyltransferase